MSQITNKWQFEPSHCKIGFSVRHFGISETEGFFKKFKGTILNENNDFSDAEVEFTIDVNSIDTQDEQRDEHLRSADFFNTDVFPVIHFKSSGMSILNDGMYQMNGGLTINGKTNPITLAVDFGGIVPKDPFGNTKAGFLVEGKIDRKDWGMTWNRALDFGGIAVGDTVKIKCHIELLKI